MDKGALRISPLQARGLEALKDVNFERINIGVLVSVEWWHGKSTAIRAHWNFKEASDADFGR